MDVHKWLRRWVCFKMKWLECEDAYLRANWRRVELPVLVKRLGRSTAAVRARAYKLALGKGWQPDYKRGYVAHSAWTAERDAEMLALLGAVSDVELARRLGRSVGAINSRLEVLAGR